MSPARIQLHTPDQREYSYAEQQGQLLRVKVKLNWSRAMPPAPRGNVTGFTRAARMRMLQTIARINWDAYGKSVFLTVTYPDAYAGRSPAKRTQDRTLLLRALEHELGGKISVLWRLEYKKRLTGKNVGRIMPHFHAVLLGVPYVDQKVVRQAWRTILGHVGPLATDVRVRKDGDTVARYAAKYAAKQDVLSALDDVSYLDMRGRLWGLTRQRFVKWSPPAQIDRLTPGQEAVAMEIARHLLGQHWVGSYFVFHHEARSFIQQIENEHLLPLDGGRPVD